MVHSLPKWICPKIEYAKNCALMVRIMTNYCFNGGNHDKLVKLGVPYFQTNPTCK